MINIHLRHILDFYKTFSLICEEKEGEQFMELGGATPFCPPSLHNLDKQIIHTHTRAE